MKLNNNIIWLSFIFLACGAAPEPVVAQFPIAGIPNTNNLQKDGTVWVYPENCSGTNAAYYVYNGKPGILSAAGRCSLNSRNSNRTWFLDFETMHFEELSSLPEGFGWSMAIEVGGAVYAFGGHVLDSHGRADVMRFENNQWLTVGFMTRQRANSQAVRVGDKVYLIGGHSIGNVSSPPEQWLPSAVTNTMEAYDLSTNTTQLLAPLPGLARGWNYVAYHEGYIYSFGGMTFEGVGEGTAAGLPDVYRYSIANNTWERLNDQPYQLSGGQALVDGDQICLVGGAKNRKIADAFGSYTGTVSLTLQSDVLCYNTSNGTYKTRAQIPMPVHNPGLVFHDEMIWIMGGENVSDVLANKINLMQIISLPSFRFLEKASF